MPMIDVTYPNGAIAPEAKTELLDELATKLLEAEKAPDTEFFRSITWVYANEIEPDLARGRRSLRAASRASGSRSPSPTARSRTAARASSSTRSTGPCCGPPGWRRARGSGSGR